MFVTTLLGLGLRKYALNLFPPLLCDLPTQIGQASLGVGLG
jgi:hypothetical protein